MILYFSNNLVELLLIHLWSLLCLLVEGITNLRYIANHGK
jgi:hypothetical protein